MTGVAGSDVSQAARPRQAPRQAAPTLDPLGRFRRLRLIRSLDPERDYPVIYRLSVGLEFPWDYTRSLELALFRTFCVPSISRLLAETGEFRRRGQKRYDDTSVLMTEMVQHGYDSPRGKQALRNVNRMHGQYDISNDDMRYVLSTFIYEPVRWIDTYGWRPLSEHEKIASYHYYVQVGRRMGIRDIPASFEEFDRFNREYEAEHFRFAESNRQVGQDNLRMMCAWFPRPLRGVVRRAVIAGLEDSMVRAFGFEAPSPAAQAAMRTALRWHGVVERLLPPRRISRLGTTRYRTYPGYPAGYDLASIGALSDPGTSQSDPGSSLSDPGRSLSHRGRSGTTEVGDGPAHPAPAS